MSGDSFECIARAVLSLFSCCAMSYLINCEDSSPGNFRHRVFAVMSWYTGKSFVCPYSLTQVVWDSARRQAWKFPKPLCAPPGEAFEAFGIAELPPLTAPKDFEALPGDEEQARRVCEGVVHFYLGLRPACGSFR